MLSKTTLGIAAGVCGTIFLGYCIYFDKQRRSDPDFKKKLHEKRKARKQAQNAYGGRGGSVMPDLKDHEAVQKFFLQEVQLGEEMLAAGELEVGVDHLANAVAVCGQPNQLLQVLQQTLPPAVFHLLIQKIQGIGTQTRSGSPKPHLTVEDIE